SRNPKTKSNPNTMCLPITLGGNHGSGHFYLAQNRTFLLCVDTTTDRESAGSSRITAKSWRGVVGQAADCKLPVYPVYTGPDVVVYNRGGSRMSGRSSMAE
ncbi:MAG: hypothetical protein WBE09_14420, partial [Candidatus Acidiferrales bacterium]